MRTVVTLVCALLTATSSWAASGNEQTSWCRRLAFFATRLGVPAPLAVAIGHHESGFNPRALSWKGARGLMQIMPDTAIQYGADPTQLWDPDTNMYTGLVILRDLLSRLDGREPLVAAAYYAGPNFWARRYSPQVSADIENYVSQVMELRHAYSSTTCR